MIGPLPKALAREVRQLAEEHGCTVREESSGWRRYTLSVEGGDMPGFQRALDKWQTEQEWWLANR